jgi:predicted histone-like DNA-binding protein
VQNPASMEHLRDVHLSMEINHLPIDFPALFFVHCMEKPKEANLMSVKFNVVERGNPANQTAPKKFYPSIQSTGRVTTRQLAEQAAQESTMSSTDIMAAIETFLTIIPRELAKGNIVELGDFGNFWLKTESDGAETAEAVKATQIKGVQPRFNPGKTFKKELDGLELVKS